MLHESRKILSGSFLRSFNFFMQLVVSFFLMPFIVHSLGDRLYGVWSLISVFLGYYGLIEFGIAAATERYLSAALGAQDYEECNRVFNSALLIFIGLGGFAFMLSCISAGLAPLLFKESEEAFLFRKIILILGMNTLIDFPGRALIGAITAQLRHDILALVEIGTLVLRTILIVWALNAGYKILGLAWITFLANIPEKLLFIYFAKKNLPSLRFDVQYFLGKTTKTLFSYSIFKFICQIAEILKFKLDEFVITISIGLTAVTHYHIASQLSLYFIQLITSSMVMLKPIFSKYDGANDRKSIQKTFLSGTKLSVYLSSFISFSLITLGKPFIHRWMGQAYLDAYPALFLLCVGCTFSLWQIPSVFLMYGISKHRFYAFLSLAEGVCNLLLSLFFVRHLGITGVALGTLIPMIMVKLVIQPIYVCRIISIKYTDYLLLMAKSVMIVLLSLILPFFISLRYAMPDYLSLSTAVVTSGFCYCSFLWLWGLEPKEKNIFRQAIISNSLRRESCIT
ncbi:MAG: oligosaccharide flippase family protein [bacterium]